MDVLFTILVGILAILITIIYILSTRKYNYWKKRNVPHLKPTLLFGNYKEYITLKKYLGQLIREICQQFPKEPYIGAYYGTEPALIVQDPELIRLITAKDFVYFNGREVTKYTEREKMTRNMFFTQGDRWKVIRQNSSPLFSLAKVRKMFPLIEKCSKSFSSLLEREVARNNGELDVRPLITRYTMDCICTCAFGIDSKTMDPDSRDNPFRKMGDLIFENSNIRGLALIFRAIWPRIFYGVGLKVFPDIISDFFHKVLTEVFESRNYEPSSRHDFVDLVLGLRKQEYLTCESMSVSNRGQQVSLKVDNELLEVQCTLFFGAGFETSSTTTSSTLFELAKNEEAQSRARKEVDEYLQRHEGAIDMDCVSELPFLEACVEEAMRLYPVFGVLTREVMADYTLPTGLVLERGLRIHLPVYHLHRDPRYFPDPDTFKPERFLPENKSQVRQYTYMPFGEGQRICIGMRVAKMQMMPGLIMILRKYRVELAEGMPSQIELDPRAIVSQSRQPIRLKFIPRDDL